MFKVLIASFTLETLFSGKSRRGCDVVVDLAATLATCSVQLKPIASLQLKSINQCIPAAKLYKRSKTLTAILKQFLFEEFSKTTITIIFVLFVLFAIFILHSRESELYRYTLDGQSALAWELPFSRFMGHLSST